MSVKAIKTRIQNKHDLEINWKKASEFIPLPGELIFYDKEVDAEGNILQDDQGNPLLPSGRSVPYTSERFKIGDGKTLLSDLPFFPIKGGTGKGSVILGDGTALGNYSVVEGYGNQAISKYSHAEGLLTVTESESSHAEGYKTIVTRPAGHAEGVLTDAKGTGSHAEGRETVAFGYVAHAEGHKTEALGHGSHTEGAITKAISDNAHAEGVSTTAGTKGFKITNIEVNTETNTGTLFVIDGSNVVIPEDSDNIYDKAEDYVTDKVAECYAIGDLLNIDVDKHQYGKYSISALEDGKIHFEGISPFSVGNASDVLVLGTADEDNYVWVEGKHVGGTISQFSGIHAEGSYTTAIGWGAHAEGRNTKAIGNYSHAEGRQTLANYGAHAEGRGTTAKGHMSHSEGQNTIAIGECAHAEGDETTASGNNSHAEGADTKALGESSHAEGVYTTASNPASHAEGWYTKASGDASHAEGSSTTASGFNSHAEGRYITASGDNSHAEGWYTKALSNNSHAEGWYTKASGDNSHAEGNSTTASGYYSHAEGNSTKTSGSNSHAEGGYTEASGDNSHAEGWYTTASGSNSHAEGRYTKASDNSSHSEGNSTTALCPASHAEGAYTLAGQMGFKVTACEKLTDTTGTYTLTSIEGLAKNQRYSVHLSSSKENCGKITAIDITNKKITVDGYPDIALSSSSSSTANYLTIVNKPKLGDILISGDFSHAEGYYTTALGNYSHAEGYYTTASGDASHAEGSSTTASGDYSHAEGSETAASGDNSHVEGWRTEASGNNSHAEGRYTTASAIASHAEGNSTKASGEASHAEGVETTASGNNSHAEGWRTEASGGFSHAEGRYTTASSNYQHVQGKYNIVDTADTYADIIGNGSSYTNRSNAATVDWYGNAWYAGAVTSNGADYAEFFEWLDGNLNNEDRVGYLVALDGEKIRFANSEDEILGIISANPAILGDNYECNWNGKYLTDEFGRILYDKVEEFIDIPKVDEETGEIIIEKKSLGFFDHPRINPDYDPNQEYINRRDRSEWAMVGMLGKLFVRDDGTAQINGYVSAGEDGIATASTEKTNMRVLSRINDHIVKVLLK